MKRILLILPLALLLLGCGASGETPAMQTEAATSPETQAIVADVEQEAKALAEAPPPAVSTVLQPEASGTMTERSDVAEVDYSHTEDGYIMVRYFGETDSRLKVLLKGPSTTYQYNLPQGQWTVLPLSDGNGSYQAGVYRNTGGTKYATVMTVRFEAALTDEFAPFLRPNQYVNYLNSPDTMEAASRLCAGLEQPLAKVEAVYDYVVANLTYDDEKAAAVKSGYLPVLDTVLAEKKGICFDYAALMTAMLRSQEVPCKLVVGYAGTVYHAWISVWAEENGWVDGIIFFDGQVWKRMDPTFASSGEQSEEIMDFIEHGNYTVKYLY